jgi:hypothetical protein
MAGQMAALQSGADAPHSIKGQGGRDEALPLENKKAGWKPAVRQRAERR